MTAFPTRLLTIRGDDGRALLTISSDGTVTGEVEDAGEAGRVFVESLRRHLQARDQQ